MAQEKKEIISYEEDVVQPGQLPEGATLVGYQSRTPVYTDAQAMLYGRAIDWLNTQANGSVETDHIVAAWRDGRFDGEPVPAWVKENLSVGFTANRSEAAEKQWKQEARLMARGYAWVVKIKKVQIVVTGNVSVRTSATSKKSYQHTVERLRRRNTGTLLLREIIDDIEGLLNKYENNRRAAELLGTVLPVLRTALTRIRNRLNRILEEAA